MKATGKEAASPMIVVIGRNVEVTDGFRAHVTQKLANLDAAEDRAVTYTVELFHEGNPRQSKICQRVEIAITGPGPTLRAGGNGPDFDLALAAALTKLRARRRRHRDRRRMRHGRRQPRDTTARAATPESEPGGPPVSPSGGDRAAIRARRVEPGSEFRLPRSTLDLGADWRAAESAERAAATDRQRAAVRLRMESLTERERHGSSAGCAHRFADDSTSLIKPRPDRPRSDAGGE